MATYSVIIPSCGRPQMLREAIYSVLKQTLPATEIFVIIDEPEDRAAYQDLFNHGSLIIEFTGGGRGAAVARNLGLRKVTTDYVLFLDDDDLWFPHKAEKQIEMLERRPECVGATCWREVDLSGALRRREVSERTLNRNILTTNFTGSFSFFGFRRNAETDACLLDEKLASAQDLDFYMSLSRYGHIAVVPEVLARYRIHGSTQITDNINIKLQALSYINHKHWSRMSFLERMWNAGKVLAMRSSLTPSKLAAVLHISQAAILLACSGRSLRRSSLLLWRSWKRRSSLARSCGRPNAPAGVGEA